MAGDGRSHSSWTFEIASEIPDFDGLIANVIGETQLLAAQVLPESGGTAVGDASQLVLTQATNDLCDLLDDVRMGRGRSAIRAARSLVEHTINYCSVQDPELARRYVAHVAVGSLKIGEMAVGEELLAGSEVKAFRHRMQALAKSVAAKAADAIATYGRRFPREWTPQTLFDRARDSDLVDLYEYYRVGSMVSHGAGGGSYGSVAALPDGLVLRTGQALSLAPLALYYALDTSIALAKKIAIFRPDVETTDFVGSLQSLARCWPEYLACISKLDRATWPTGQPMPPMGVVKVYPSGKIRWYLDMAETGMVAPALAPDVTPLGIDKLIEAAVQVQKPVLSIMLNFRPRVRAGAPLIPREQLKVGTTEDPNDFISLEGMPGFETF